MIWLLVSSSTSVKIIQGININTSFVPAGSLFGIQAKDWIFVLLIKPPNLLFVVKLVPFLWLNTFSMQLMLEFIVMYGFIYIANALSCLGQYNTVTLIQPKYFYYFSILHIYLLIYFIFFGILSCKNTVDFVTKSTSQF